jgi:hypothetical protein
VPIPEPLRQRLPFASVFTLVDQGVKQYTVFDFDIPPLYRQQPGYSLVLFLGQFQIYLSVEPVAKVG